MTKNIALFITIFLCLIVHLVCQSNFVQYSQKAYVLETTAAKIEANNEGLEMKIASAGSLSRVLAYVQLKSYLPIINTYHTDRQIALKP